jgi:ABC-type multidrug transport system fused ATPase/permease subunit
MNFVKKSFSLLSPNDKKKFPLVIFFMVLASVFEVLSISLLIPAVSLLLDISYRINLINFFKSFNFFFSSYSDEFFIYIFVTSLFLIFIIKFLYTFFLIYFRTNWVTKISIQVSNNLFTSYLYRSYKFHLQNRSSKSILSIINEVQALSQNVLIPFLEICTEGLIILGLLIFMFLYEPTGTFLVIFTGFLTVIIYFKYTHSKTKIWSQERRLYELDIMKLIQFSLGGIKEVIMFKKRDHFIKEFIEKNIKLNNIFKKQYAILDSAKYYIELVALFSIFGLIFLLLIFNKNEITILLVKLSLFAVIFFKVLPAINRIILAKQRITFALASVDNIYEQLNYFELSLKKKNYYRKNSKDKLSFKKNIELNNIHYSYDHKNILKDLNLNINKGETIGLIGHSGAGKSTLINIIAGLLRPNKGIIFVDNVSVDKQIELWQQNIGYVPQNFYMLDDSIRSNIIFEPNFLSKEKDDKIYDVLEKAQILDFVKSLPEKLDTILGERGSSISVGQAQRLSIARALFKDPELLILDEATSSLDAQNEKKILNTIKTLRGKKTIVVVSHKESSLSFCDKIYKIENRSCKKIK